MTISIYTGTPGSGKSLHAARTIRNYLKVYKLPVIANFEVIKDARWEGDFTYMPNCSMSPGNLRAFACDRWKLRDFEEDGILLVVDECQLLWNSRTWQDPSAFGSSSRMEWIEFFSQHRKFGYKIVLIAQSALMVDKQFRSLIEYEFQHRKVSNIGLGGRIFSLFCGGNLFYCCKTYYGLKTKVGGEFFRYSRKLGSMYDSYKAFNPGEQSSVLAYER